MNDCMFAEVHRANTPLLEARNLRHEFRGGTRGLDGIDLALQGGEFAVMAGPNGSGKTLLARHLICLMKPTQGQVLFRGQAAASRIAELRKSVGYIFQDADSQFLRDCVFDEACYGPENLGMKKGEVESRAEVALAKVGLLKKAHAKPSHLSGGEKRRLAVAGVLSMGSEFIIFDEPFANLDYPGIQSVLSCMLELHGEGVGILVLTHEIEKVLAHADRLIVMSEGKVAIDGTPIEVLQGGLGRYGIRDPLTPCAGLGDLTWLD